MSEDKKPLEVVDPEGLKQKIYHAIAEHFEIGFQDPEAVNKHLAGTPIPKIDAQQIEQMLQAFCAIATPICAIIGKPTPPAPTPSPAPPPKSAE